MHVEKNKLKTFFMEKKDFLSLGLSNWLVNQVAAVGYKTPTPVQENCIPVILEGRKNFDLCCLNIPSF